MLRLRVKDKLWLDNLSILTYLQFELNKLD